MRACDGLCWPLLHFQHLTRRWDQSPRLSALRLGLSGWGRPPVFSSAARQGPAPPTSSARPPGLLCDDEKDKGEENVGSARLPNRARHGFSIGDSTNLTCVRDGESVMTEILTQTMHRSCWRWPVPRQWALCLCSGCWVFFWGAFWQLC